MRVGRHSASGVAAILALLTGLFFASWNGAAAHPQGTTVLAPDASNAKAREVIARAIQALGGPAYLGVKDMTRSGRYSAFDHNGSARGSIMVTDMIKWPDKERIEYRIKIYWGGAEIPGPIPMPIRKIGTTYQVHNGNQGWILASGGIEEMLPESLARIRDQRRKDINLLFRSRLNEPDLILRYTGQDLLDMKLVEWIESSDIDRFTIRIAFDRSTHLPIHATYLYRDPETHDPIQEDDEFSVYHTFQGIASPLQISHDRQGYRVNQMFFDEVKYNTGLDDSLFTREGLEAIFKSGKDKK